MHITSKPSMQKSWAKAIAQPAAEFPHPYHSLRSDTSWLCTLYRNGPARLERGGVRVGHWFDGDGAILAVNFTDAGATFIATFKQMDTRRKRRHVNSTVTMAWPHQDQFGINGSNHQERSQYLAGAAG